MYETLANLDIPQNGFKKQNIISDLQNDKLPPH